MITWIKDRSNKDQNQTPVTNADDEDEIHVWNSRTEKINDYLHGYSIVPGLRLCMSGLGRVGTVQKPAHTSYPRCVEADECGIFITWKDGKGIGKHVERQVLERFQVLGYRLIFLS